MEESQEIATVAAFWREALFHLARVTASAFHSPAVLFLRPFPLCLLRNGHPGHEHIVQSCVVPSKEAVVESFSVNGSHFYSDPNRPRVINDEFPYPNRHCRCRGEALRKHHPAIHYATRRAFSVSGRKQIIYKINVGVLAAGVARDNSNGARLNAYLSREPLDLFLQLVHS